VLLDIGMVNKMKAIQKDIIKLLKIIKAYKIGHPLPLPEWVFKTLNKKDKILQKVKEIYLT